MIVSVLCLWLVYPLLAKPEETPCRTPNGELSICKPFSSCSVIKEAIYSLNPLAAEFARNSQCGFESEPLVCCGSVGFPTNGTHPPASPLLPDRNTCGFGIAADRIFGGTVSPIGEFPWMALLGYQQDGSFAGFKCGGSLINERYVLTAAHCARVDEDRAGMTLDRVRLGEWQISTTTDCEAGNVHDCVEAVDVGVESLVPHRQYSRRYGDNDIALIRLNESVEFTDHIRPICLPAYNNPKPIPGTEVVVAGWGSTETGSSSDLLLRVSVPVIANAECASKLKSRGTVSENQVCAGGVLGKDACQGDSGGPLMNPYLDEHVKGQGLQWYQEGIVAWGVGCARKGAPAVYTRVSRYLNWIVENMSEF